LELSGSLNSYFPSLSTTEMQWVVSCFGPRGEENIMNANLTSMEKEHLLKISSDTMLNFKLYESQID